MLPLLSSAVRVNLVTPSSLTFFFMRLLCSMMTFPLCVQGKNILQIHSRHMCNFSSVLQFNPLEKWLVCFVVNVRIDVVVLLMKIDVEKKNLLSYIVKMVVIL